MYRYLIILLVAGNIYGSQIVTSHQVLYDLTKQLTKGSNYEVINLFGGNFSYKNQSHYFKNIDDKVNELARDTIATVSFYEINKWDLLFPQFRKQDIYIINLDPTGVLQGRSGISYIDGYFDIWFSMSNMLKLADNLAIDLIKLDSDYQELIYENLSKYKQNILLKRNQFAKSLEEIDRDYILISKELRYFAEEFSLFTLEYYFNQGSKEEAEGLIKLAKVEEVDTILATYWPRSEVRDILKENNLNLVVFDNMDIPKVDFLDELLDDSYLKIYEENIELLKELD